MPRHRPLLVAIGIILMAMALRGITAAHAADPEVTVTQCYVSDGRANVGSDVTVGFRLVWADSGQPLSYGEIVVDGRSHSVLMDGWVLFTDSYDDPIRKEWVITSVSFNGYPRTFQVMEDFPVCLFDKVIITLIPEYDRTTIGEEPSMIVYSHYASNYETFTGTVKLNYTDDFDYIGTKGVKVISITDPLYGINEFETNTVKITWDRVKVELFSPRRRYNPGREAKIDYLAYYESDMTTFVGQVKFNDTLSQDEVGRYAYTVESIMDWRNGIKAYTTNVVHAIFDKVHVELDVADTRINVGDEADISYTASYVYDGSEFMGNVSFKVRRLSTVGEEDVSVWRVVDRKWFLDTFESNSVEVIWDRLKVDIEAPDARVDVGEEVTIGYSAYYEYDSTPLEDGEVSLNRESYMRDDVGDFTFKVKDAHGGKYNISVVEGGELTVVWDKVEFEADTPIIRVIDGSNPEPKMTGVYAYDGTPFTGTYQLAYRDQQGFKTYSVASMTDQEYDLKGFTSGEGSCFLDTVTVKERLVHMIPGSLKIVYLLNYQSDNAPVLGAVVDVNGQTCVNQGNGVYEASLSSVLPMVTTNARVTVGNELVNQVSSSQLLVGNSATMALAAVMIGLIAKKVLVR
ncbi:hypothetical protein JXL21_02265 [Candidatus Bathyarchaeota archaeon]|nr:hypothetical protein [Candidatus Bathyarchaeota archaeon]